MAGKMISTYGAENSMLLPTTITPKKQQLQLAIFLRQLESAAVKGQRQVIGRFVFENPAYTLPASKTSTELAGTFVLKTAHGLDF